jgi:peroxiredoxin
VRLQLIALVAGLAGCATPPKQSPTVRAEQVAFELRDLKGSVVRTGDFTGKVVLVDFWATWCKPCEASFPFYDDLARKFADRGFVVLGVSVDEEDDVVRQFLERKPVGFTILRDPSGSVPARFDLKTMPTAVLIGRDGEVRHVHEGFETQDEAKITRMVEDALSEDAVAPGDEAVAPGDEAVVPGDEAVAPGDRPKT